MNHYEIAVMGDWHLAFVTSACLSSVGHKTALVKPLNLNSTPWNFPPQIPVLEPGLEEMMKLSNDNGLLFYENGVIQQDGGAHSQNSWTADFIWMAVDTPVSEQDEPQLEPLWVIARQVATFSTKPKAFIVSSQVPIGFCSELEKKIGVPIVYVPENLRLGKGIETFLYADRTVLGCDHPGILEKVRLLFKDFKTQILECNLITSEMVKHANNAFLATSISFANELARIGEKFGVDSAIVGKALKLDKRIGQSAYVVPGLGFAGGTLPRDLRVLKEVGKKSNIPTLLIDAVLQINENTTHAVFEIISNHIRGQSLAKRVLILGYTYKADTDTLRRSLSIDLAKKLVENDYEVVGFDPVMNHKKSLSEIEGIISHQSEMTDIFKLLVPPSVVICLTARPSFKEIPWNVISENWSNKKTLSGILVIDTQSILSESEVLNSGMEFQKLWSSKKKPLSSKLNKGA